MAIDSNLLQQQANDLSSKLWAIANDLRGGIDANEFRNYILGTIFYRYLSERTEMYMEEILKVSHQYGYKHFFYGSSKETTDKMVEVIKERYPGVSVAGVYNPPFRPLTEEEDKEVIQMITDAEPDFVWVGLGAPKQEIWMAEHQNKIPGLMVGVGAAFDYLAGNIQRAPDWMQKANLEWFYRLCQDPKRLFKRYFITNTSFIWNAVIRGK